MLDTPCMGCSNRNVSLNIFMISFEEPQVSHSRRHDIVFLRVMPPVKLPAFVTPALLSSIRGHPQLPLHSWYFITGVTLSVLNRPEEIANVFQHALETGPGRTDAKPEHGEQLQMARKMREALVKAAPIGGLPKVWFHCEDVPRFRSTSHWC